MALSQVMESLLSQVYIYLVFFTSRSVQFAERTAVRPWVCAIAVFQFYSCWFMAWTSITTRLYARNPYVDGNQRKKKMLYTLFHPMFLNAFFCTIPALVTSGSAYMFCDLMTTFYSQYDRMKVVEASLRKGSIAWTRANATSKHNSAQAALESVPQIARAFGDSLTAGLQLGESIRSSISADRRESYFWVGVLAMTCLIYILSFWMLLVLISSGINRRKQVQIGLVSISRNNPSLSQARSGSESRVQDTNRLAPSTASSLRRSPEQRAIIRGYRYFAFHGTLMILSMLCTIVVRIILGIKAEQLNWEADWRARGSWLTLVSGAFAALATTFQCVRTVIDFAILIPVDTGSSRSSSDTYANDHEPPISRAPPDEPRTVEPLAGNLDIYEIKLQ